MSFHGKLTIRVGRRSAQGCAGASASFHHGTAPQYQTRLSLNGLLDTDSAGHHLVQAVIGEERNLVVAAQVNGDVREWQEYQVREAVILAQSPSS